MLRTQKKKWWLGVRGELCPGMYGHSSEIDAGSSEESQGTWHLSSSFLPYLFPFLFICVVQDPQGTDDRGHLSQVTLLSCFRRVGNSLWDGAPIPPSGPYSDQNQCLPLRTLAAHRKLGWCPGWGAGTPHLPASPSVPHPSFPLYYHFCT